MLRQPKLSRLVPIVLLVLALSAPAWADFEQAMSYFKAGKYVEAAAEFQALVDESPGYADGYHLLGLSFLQMNKPADAIKNFQKAIELNGDRFEFHYNLANAYMKSKDYGKAVATLKTAEGLATDNKSKLALYTLRGTAYTELEKWGDAVEDLERAKALGKSPAVLDRLGLAYYSLGHHDKAVPVLKEELAAAPNNDGALLRLTNGLLDLGAEAKDDATKDKYYGEALQYADKYQKNNPTNFESYNMVGRAALGAKEYDRAAKAFERVLELKPDYCYAMVNRGKISIVQEKWSEAEATFRRAAECAPRLSVVYESLGYSLQKQDKLPEAIEQYNKALQINPKAPVKTLIDTCQKNIEIHKENVAAEEEEAKAIAAQKAEEERIAEEKRKREEWEKKHRDD